MRTPIPGPISSTSLLPSRGRLPAIRWAISISVRKCCPKYFLALTSVIFLVVVGHFTLVQKLEKFNVQSFRKSIISEVSKFTSYISITYNLLLTSYFFLLIFIVPLQNCKHALFRGAKIDKFVGMKKLFIKIGNCIRNIIDFFYPPFKRFMSPQLFRYAACGGSNMLFDCVLYYFIFNYVLHQQAVDFGFFVMRSDWAALTIKFPITLLTGFLLQKYVTFSLANASRGRVQLFRYLQVVIMNLGINYIGLYFFVDILHFYPSIANATNAVITSFFSYFAQKLYTFRFSK